MNFKSYKPHNWHDDNEQHSIQFTTHSLRTAPTAAASDGV